ncbi:hypothetical protein ACFY9G_35960 [Streptomyces anthocyanicus]|uniref:Uncharacterized protein n=1 Tax=Streptomyces violaceolatus TaxID=67378 RepID=A0ABN3T8T3_9ACTN|nr:MULTISPECIES: hypothetical protein [Streptomyces]MDX3348592.1 hypothetical protein [Streptomyces sp. ME02-6979A]
MKHPMEMAAMQTRLHHDRDALRNLRDLVAYWQQGLRYHPGQTRQFTDAAKRLMDLSQYRRMGIGWAEHNQPGNEHFKELRSGEHADRRTVTAAVGGLIEGMRQAGILDRAPDLPREYNRFISIPHQERELYRARRDWAREIVATTADAIPYASNQIHDIAASGGMSFRNMDHLFDESNIDEAAPMEMQIAQRAVLAEQIKTGACDEQGMYAFTEANRLLPDTLVTLANVPPGHQMVIIGPPNCPESAHIDSWPAQPTVTNPATYGMTDIQEASVDHQTVADGRNLRDEALVYLRGLPSPAVAAAPISMRRAADLVRTEEDVDQETYWITRTTDDRNSDSETDNDLPRYGHTLSREAFTASLANGFEIQPVPGAQSPSGQDARLVQGFNSSYAWPVNTADAERATSNAAYGGNTFPSASASVAQYAGRGTHGAGASRSYVRRTPSAVPPSEAYRSGQSSRAGRSGGR